jgi:hypothetical protein
VFVESFFSKLPLTGLVLGFAPFCSEMLHSSHGQVRNAKIQEAFGLHHCHGPLMAVGPPPEPSCKANHAFPPFKLDCLTHALPDKGEKFFSPYGVVGAWMVALVTWSQRY